MTSGLVTPNRIQEICMDVELKLQQEHMDRLTLAALETALIGITPGLTGAVGEAVRLHGRTPDTILAQLALQAMKDALSWLRLYRRHASIAERREHLETARASAQGALEHLQLLYSAPGPPAS